MCSCFKIEPFWNFVCLIKFFSCVNSLTSRNSWFLYCLSCGQLKNLNEIQLFQQRIVTHTFIDDLSQKLRKTTLNATFHKKRKVVISILCDRLFQLILLFMNINTKEWKICNLKRKLFHKKSQQKCFISEITVRDSSVNFLFVDTEFGYKIVIYKCLFNAIPTNEGKSTHRVCHHKSTLAHCKNCFTLSRLLLRRSVGVQKVPLDVQILNTTALYQFIRVLFRIIRLMFIVTRSLCSPHNLPVDSMTWGYLQLHVWRQNGVLQRIFDFEKWKL